ncbi:MAG: NAD(P)-dependent oxidoreductase, partial [Fimbriimonadaceae bacterium]|nr:NAD(P)-dependent oxidoreductase [Fimbriimonadaceae bacterium]
DHPGHIQGDLRDRDTMRRACEGMDAVCHNGAAAWNIPDRPGECFDINVRGTWTVMEAAVEAGVQRVIFHSSLHAIGVPGVRIPLRDDLPRRIAFEYQASKAAGETIVEGMGRHAGITTLALRSTAIMDERRLSWGQRHTPEEQEQQMSYSLGGFVAAGDVARAVLAGLTRPLTGHSACLLAHREIGSRLPTREFVARYLSDLEVDPDWSLEGRNGLIDTRASRELLGWEAQRDWEDVIAGRIS